MTSSVFVDTFSLGYIDIAIPGTLEEVKITGAWHKGAGEMVGIEHLFKDHYLVEFNIDGCSWVYEGIFDEKKRMMTLKNTLVGAKPFDNVMLERLDYNKAEDSITFSFSTATSPTQIYTVSGKKRNKVTRHTDERILGIADGTLSKGEDASFMTYDGLRVWVSG